MGMQCQAPPQFNPFPQSEHSLLIRPLPHLSPYQKHLTLHNLAMLRLELIFQFKFIWER